MERGELASKSLLIRCFCLFPYTFVWYSCPAQFFQIYISGKTIVFDCFVMRAEVLMFKQDDPAKCTAAKLVRFGLAESIRSIKRDALLLDPFSKNVLTSSDSLYGKSVCAIDCSWEKAQLVLTRSGSRHHSRRRLPALLAGNPTNYSKISKLTTAEALAASLFILGWRTMSENLLAKFKWGHTFLELNLEVLDDYASAPDTLEIRKLERKYFPQIF